MRRVLKFPSVISTLIFLVLATQGLCWHFFFRFPGPPNFGISKHILHVEADSPSISLQPPERKGNPAILVQIL